MLTDLQGKKVDFAKYRGKYVFIDLWASWCIPCIKEIPHLKQLEKDLQNKDVGFLVFTLSAVRTTGQFGILGAAAFFWGCLADLTLSPALLSFLKPLGKEHEPQVRA